jgi:stress response protein YsnF
VIRKDVTEEAHTIRDTVRRTEVEVEDGRTGVASKRPLSDRDLDRSDI